MKVRFIVISILMFVFIGFNYITYTIFTSLFENPLQTIIQLVLNIVLIYFILKLPTLNN